MARVPVLDTASLASRSGIQNASYTYAADAEASDSYAITLSPAPSAYAAGQEFSFKANTANTGAATLNVNGLGAKTLKKNRDQDLATGDIEAGSIVKVVYDGTNFQVISVDANLNMDEIADGSTNRLFTDTEKTKLAGIETAADVTDAGNVGSSINGATEKTTPVGGDLFGILDSAASNVLKKLTLTNLLSFLSSATQTLTNKTIDANGTGNAISNLEVADFAAAAIVTAADTIASNDNDTTVPTSAAVIDYVAANGGGGTLVGTTPGSTAYTASTEETIFTKTVPGGTLGTTGVVDVFVYINGHGLQNTLTHTLRLKWGGTTFATISQSNAASGQAYFIHVRIFANGSTTAQRIVYHQDMQTSTWVSTSGVATDTKDTASDQAFSITSQFNTTHGTNTLTFQMGYVRVSVA